MIIDDDSLILHYYDDGQSPGERRRIDAALRDDPVLAQRYRALTATLAGWCIDADGPPPPAASLHRWQSGLQRAARLDAAPPAGRRFMGWPLWIGGALAALVLVVAVSMHRLDPGAEAPAFVLVPPPQMESIAVGEPLSPLQRGMQAYLEAAGDQLDALAADNPAQRARVVADLLERNRSYQRAASEQDADRMVRALRAFEPALLTLADARTDTPTFLATRDRLSFELGVVHARLLHVSRT